MLMRTSKVWAQKSREHSFLTEAAVMISAPWLHHSTGETPGGLMENCTAVRLPICTAVRGGHGRVSKTAARVMTPKVNVMLRARRWCSYRMTTAHCGLKSHASTLF